MSPPPVNKSKTEPAPRIYLDLTTTWDRHLARSGCGDEIAGSSNPSIRRIMSTEFHPRDIHDLKMEILEPEINQRQSSSKSLLCGTPRKKVHPPYTVSTFLQHAVFAAAVVAIITTSVLVTVTKTDTATKCQSELRHTLLGIDALTLSADAPQSKATEWMAMEDSACEAGLTAARLEQRYALLVIYFGMSVKSASSNLIAPGIHECDWVNVGCDSANQVTEIQLIRAVGTLVEEIALLSSLTSLRTIESNIHGTIPAGLLSLSNLVHLELRGNKMQGRLPSEFGRLSKLEHLNLQNNALTGILPESFSSLTKLRELILDFNSLEGNMMSIICKLPEIVLLSLSGTKIVGTIPTEIGDLTHLKGFFVTGTSIVGSIPSEIGLLTSLTMLSGSMTSLQGRLPSEIGHLRFLVDLQLSDADMNGPIPTELGLCTMLTSLEIAGNSFSGAVPSELGKLTSLLVIDAEENAFTGTIPTELGMLSNLSVFNFHRNGKMSGTLPGDLCAVSHNLASGDDCSCCS
ncbi:hypothetical protein MHU86_8172 [Fragilaria crotonensis]|nr:hypothetical protein MHU86_8172 [Fragilaria crotonensis]